MAAVNLAIEYSKIVDERWEAKSVVGAVLSRDKFNFKGERTVVVYSIPVSPMVDYSRSGSSRYGTPGDLARNIQEMTVTRDRGFTFIIDKGDDIQSQNVTNAGMALAREINECVVPEYDTYCFSVMAESAEDNGHYSGTAINKSNAFQMLLNGIQHMSDRNVPIENCVCFCTFAFGGLLMQDSSFVKSSDIAQKLMIEGYIGRAAGVDIVLVPNTRLPAGAAFLIVHRDACVAPYQIREYKIHDDPPGISGQLCEGRVLYDCFVLDEKSDGIYYHGGQNVIKTLRFMTAAAASGKSTVILNCEKEAAANKWYYITAATKAALPTVTFGTAIDRTATGSWYGAVQLTAVSTDITVTSGHKYIAVVEVDSNEKPVCYDTKKLNVG